LQPLVHKKLALSTAIHAIPHNSQRPKREINANRNAHLRRDTAECDKAAQEICTASVCTRVDLRVVSLIAQPVRRRTSFRRRLIGV
jgi:hypothetical protein